MISKTERDNVREYLSHWKMSADGCVVALLVAYDTIDYLEAAVERLQTEVWRLQTLVQAQTKD
jgi:hypothetical protein